MDRRGSSRRAALAKAGVTAAGLLAALSPDFAPGNRCAPTMRA
jgi:hypothetical protein